MLVVPSLNVYPTAGCANTSGMGQPIAWGGETTSSGAVDCDDVVSVPVVKPGVIVVAGGVVGLVPGDVGPVVSGLGLGVAWSLVSSAVVKSPTVLAPMVTTSPELSPLVWVRPPQPLAAAMTTRGATRRDRYMFITNMVAKASGSGRTKSSC
jgi:hypothetical protein